MLIWVLQSSHCFKIRLAQHCGRRGANVSENEGVRSECKKFGEIQDKWLLFQRFVTSIVASILTPMNATTGFHLCFFKQQSGALTICMENPKIPGRIQMERFIPVEIFRKKVIRFEVLPFSRFYRNDRNFLYHLFGLPVPGFMSRESEKFTGIL